MPNINFTPGMNWFQRQQFLWSLEPEKQAKLLYMEAVTRAQVQQQQREISQQENAETIRALGIMAAIAFSGLILWGSDLLLQMPSACPYTLGGR